MNLLLNSLNYGIMNKQNEKKIELTTLQEIDKLIQEQIKILEKKIKEHLDTNRWLECSFEINIATLNWCKANCNKQIYELHVPKTAEICVPIWTDGKVRVDEAIIIKKI